MQFIEYPKCSTCIKAKKHLMKLGVEFDDRNIVDDNPTKKELEEWATNNSLDIKRMFNTSGKLYKELGLSIRLKEMNNDEKLEILASNGMLIKRPLIIKDDGTILIGYNEEQYNKLK